MSHLDEAQLTAMLDGELAPADRKAAEQHLAGCSECRRLREEIESFSREADALLGAVVPTPRGAPAAPPTRPATQAGPVRRPLPWRTLAWAATVVAAVGLGYLARSPARPTAAGDIGELTDPARSPQPQPAATQPMATPPASETVRARVAPPAAQPRREIASPAERSDAAPAAPSPAATNLAEADAAPTADQSLEGRLGAAAGVSAKQANSGPGLSFRQVSMEEAVRILGGTIRLLDGLEPQRVLSGPDAPGGGRSPTMVRVIYEDPPGRELWLDQQRAGARDEGPAAAGAMALLPGDTTVSPLARGMQSVRWIDQAGFRLALTGFLPADSLRGLMRRVE